MPTRPKKPCSYPRCPELVAKGAYCEKHKKNRYERTSQGKEAQKLYNYRWKKSRANYLKSYPICRSCEEKGLSEPATLIDHIIPHKGNYDLFWDMDNWQPLCKRCHDIKTALEDGGWGAIPKHRPTNITTSLSPVTIVCGPPGSGKSYYANEMATKNDLIIDLDVIKAEVTGTRIYERQDDKARDAAIVKRNQILEQLGKQKRYEQVYFIISGAKKEERQWWSNKLGAKITIIDTPADECIKRIEADERRTGQEKRDHIGAVKRWWMAYEG